MRASPTWAERLGLPAPAPPTLSYWQATREPLYCLVFLLPMVATYEFGAALLRIAQWPERELVAVRVVHGVLATLGAPGVWMPGAALLLTLLTWHLISRRSWQIRGWAPLLMLMECALLTPPLFALNLLPLSAGDTGGARVAEQMVLALGAGIYEELIFRLGAISMLAILLLDVCRLPRRIGEVLAVALAAGLFAWCHFEPVGSRTFHAGDFARIGLAGAYLSMIYLTRGLGISTGCHALYNLTLVALHAA